WRQYPELAHDDTGPLVEFIERKGLGDILKPGVITADHAIKIGVVTIARTLGVEVLEICDALKAGDQRHSFELAKEIESFIRAGAPKDHLLSIETHCKEFRGWDESNRNNRAYGLLKTSDLATIDYYETFVEVLCEYAKGELTLPNVTFSDGVKVNTKITLEMASEIPDKGRALWQVYHSLMNAPRDIVFKAIDFADSFSEDDSSAVMLVCNEMAQIAREYGTDFLAEYVQEFRKLSRIFWKSDPVVATALSLSLRSENAMIYEKLRPRVEGMQILAKDAQLKKFFDKLDQQIREDAQRRYLALAKCFQRAKEAERKLHKLPTAFNQVPLDEQETIAELLTSTPALMEPFFGLNKHGVTPKDATDFVTTIGERTIEVAGNLATLNEILAACVEADARPVACAYLISHGHRALFRPELSNTEILDILKYSKVAETLIDEALSYAEDGNETHAQAVLVLGANHGLNDEDARGLLHKLRYAPQERVSAWLQDRENLVKSIETFRPPKDKAASSKPTSLLVKRKSWLEYKDDYLAEHPHAKSIVERAVEISERLATNRLRQVVLHDPDLTEIVSQHLVAYDAQPAFSLVWASTQFFQRYLERLRAGDDVEKAMLSFDQTNPLAELTAYLQPEETALIEQLELERPRDITSERSQPFACRRLIIWGG
ncbi:MAG: hypothetical protein KDD53_08505, partial [Bdellovibrionales bacterium]|nr:hypothetical protein [Bdellovibrionales bacterium]